MEELERLRRENEALRLQVAQLIVELARLNERVGELLAVAQRNQRRPAAPAASLAPAPTVEGEARRAFEARPKAPEKTPEERPAKKKARPTGGSRCLAISKPKSTSYVRRLAPRAVARRWTSSTSSSKRSSTSSRSTSAAASFVATHAAAAPAASVRPCARCRPPTTAPRSPASGSPGSSTRSSGCSRPLDRIRRDLAERSIPLAMSTLVTFIERAADLLSGIDGLHWKQLLASPWIATDGTGLKVIVPQLPAAHNGYIELYRNEETAVFQYEPTKSGDIVTAKLRSFRGTLTADAEHRFNQVFTKGSVVEAGCNAHGRRKFRDAEATQPVLAAEGGAFIAAMYAAENKAQDLGLRADDLRAHRQRHIRPVVSDFEQWLDAVKPTLLPSEPLAAAIRYYQNHRDALFRFIEDPLVPIDNSATEREFQNVAKLRLNMLFAGSTEGAHRACVLLGIVATCRALRVPAQAYLAWAFERLGTHRDVFDLPLDDMTPAAFKKSLA